MELQQVRERPSISDFIPISDHESETPDTFFGGPPVLHAYSPTAMLVCGQSEYGDISALQRLGPEQIVSATPSPTEGQEPEVEIDGLEIWVSSRELIIFSPSKSSGIKFSYPSIALHAVSDSQTSDQVRNRQQYVFLQVRPENEEEVMNEEDVEYLDLKLIPLSLFNETRYDSQTNEHGVNGTNGNIALDPVKAIFEAISACSDLHPDPNMSDDEGEPELGASGWITAENMNDFIDEDGNFIGGHAMGPGAGTVRPRGDRDEGTQDEDPIHRSDSEHGDDPTKRRRTD